MEDSSTKMDVDQVIAYSDDLIEYLKNRKDTEYLMQQLEQSNALQFQCDADYNNVQSLLQGYEKKIYETKKKTDKAKPEAAGDAELDLLEKELEEELQRERSLREELRVTMNELGDLECQRASIEQQRQFLKKLELDKPRAEMKLSMYASVTNLVPDLHDHSKISGYIVQRDRKAVEKFDLGPPAAAATAFDTCNSIWKMMNQ